MKLQDYLNNKYWYMQPAFQNVSYLTVLKNTVKNNWYDLCNLLFEQNVWKIRTNGDLVKFLKEQNTESLKNQPLIHLDWVINDFKKLVQLGLPIKHWWGIKWFDSKGLLKQQLQTKLKITDWEQWLVNNADQCDFLDTLDLDTFKLLYPWGLAFAQMNFLHREFYLKYAPKQWFSHPSQIMKAKVQYHFLFLLQIY